MLQNEWIYDWNTATPPEIPAGTPVLLDDETLRDGLQNPSVFDPSIEDKLEILHLMESLGIDAVNIGLPRSEEHTSELQSLTNLVCRLLLEKKKQKREHP